MTTTPPPPEPTDDEIRVRIAPGAIVGRLTVIECTRQSKSRNWLWMCRCECGNTKEISGSDLARKHTISCGCFRKDTNRANKTTHGQAGRKKHSREYQIYRGMINRCKVPSNPAYPDYGGRGITICERWRSSFANFFADMGACPDGLSIDRINNDGNYEPSNCRWATVKQQNENRRKRRWFKKPLATINGETQ